MKTDYLSKLISDFAERNCTFDGFYHDSTKIKTHHKFLGFSYNYLFMKAFTVKVSVALHMKCTFYLNSLRPTFY